MSHSLINVILAFYGILLIPERAEIMGYAWLFISEAIQIHADPD